MNKQEKEFKIGIELEEVHTQDHALAAKIASAHIGEDPNYYTSMLNAGLVADEDDSCCGQEEATTIGSVGNVVKNEKGNHGDYSKKTLPKQPAPEDVKQDGVIIHQNTGAEMPNHVALKKTLPFTDAPAAVSATPKMVDSKLDRLMQRRGESPEQFDKTIADPVNQFIGQIAAISLQKR
jgi:hypothetical protein